jgi:hypothetical protein
MRSARTLWILVVACAAVFALPAGAQAAAIYKYDANIDATGVSSLVPGGDLRVNDLDTAKDTRVVVTSSTGTLRDDHTQPSGSDTFYRGSIDGLSPGDIVTVRQPSASVTPTETYTIPVFSLNVVTGATVITGTLPAGLVAGVSNDYRCDSRPLARSHGAGPFSQPTSKILPGEQVSLYALSAAGDQTSYIVASPGETPCVAIRTDGHVLPPPGSPPDPAQYTVGVSHLIKSIAQNVRVVVRHGNSVLTDASADSMYVNSTFSTAPLPGDVVDVYRPKTAATPSYSVTIPQVTAKFDPTIDLLAVDAPPAAAIYTGTCRAFACSNENIRARLDLPAGRSFYDFSKSEGAYAPLDLRPDDFASVEYLSPDQMFELHVRGQAGDLVPPKQSFKLPSSLKLSAIVKALKKGLKIKLKSNEAGTAKLTLGKLATAKGNVKVGTTTLKFKFTKSGKKAINKLAAKGKKAKSLSVTLTSVVTDGSGNASTVAKTTKIKP